MNGYHYVDATGLDLNNLGKVDGLNAKCKTAISLGKPVFFTGVKNGTEDIIPIPVALMMASTAVNAYAATGNLSIAANDTVSALTENRTAKSKEKK